MTRIGTTFGNAAVLFQFAGGLVLVLALTTGCRLVKGAVELPGQAVTAASGGRSTTFDPAALQVELQRYADEFAGRTVAALNDYATLAGTVEARRQVLKWKVSVGWAAVTIVTGPSPQANLLDFVALATGTRMALEEVWTQTTNGPAFEPWLAISRSLEADAWNLTDGIFNAEQKQEVRDAIQHWWDTNPDGRLNFFARPEEFSLLIRKTARESSRPGTVFAIVGFDPTAGLDPAVREVTRTRLFAERAMFMVQRMPFLVSGQVELLADQLLREEPIAGVLTNTVSLTESVDRIGRAVESASATAAEMPDRISAERRAILKALEAQEGQLRQLSADVTRTLVAGEAMSTALNSTFTTFDALMKRFGVGEPSDAPPNTNASPFNILDYAHTAEQVAAMARQLDALMKDTGTTLESPALDRQLGMLSQRARADAKSVLNHAFLLAAGLIVLALACALIHRRVGRGFSVGEPKDAEGR